MCNKCLDHITYERTVDCPSLQPGTRSSAVTMRHQVGVDLLSLLRMLTVPSENVAAVTMRVEATPNCAPRWTTHSGIPHCEQLIFVDTRQTPADLDRDVRSALYLNHVLTTTGMLSVDRVVPREVANTKCQCGARRCPADEHRLEVARKRLGLRMAKEPFYVPNNCCFTSDHYDQALVGDAKDLHGLNQSWQIYDSGTKFPLLPEPCAHEDLFVFAVDGEDWLVTKFTEPLFEQAKKTDTNGKVTRRFLEVNDVDTAEVLQRHAASEHATRMCAVDTEHYCQAIMLVRIADALACTREDAALLYAELLGDDGGEKVDFRNPPGKSSLSKRAAPVFDDNKQALAALHELCELAIKSKTKHGHDCSCLMETFVRHRCKRQIDLTLVPTPMNLFFHTVGDSIFDVMSPIMRRYASIRSVGARANQIALQHLSIIDGVRSSSEHHFDNVIAKSVDLQRVLRKTLGTFTCHGELGERMVYRLSSNKLTWHFYSDFIAANWRKHGNLAAPPAPLFKDYDDLLAQSIRLFRAPDTISSLIELALWRGVIASQARWPEPSSSWLPGYIALLVSHAIGSGDIIAQQVRDVLDCDEAKKNFLCELAEPTLVEELLVTNNRRLAMARICGLVKPNAGDMRQYRRVIVATACVVTLICQFDEVAELQAVENAQRTLPAAPVVEKSRTVEKKKKMTHVKTPKQRKKKDPAPPLLEKTPAQPHMETSRSKKRQYKFITRHSDNDDWRVIGVERKKEQEFAAAAMLKPVATNCRHSLADFMRSEAGVDVFNMTSFDSGYINELVCV